MSARSIIHRDPRRRGRACIAVWCWCGTFRVYTPEELAKLDKPPCPNGCTATTAGEGS